MILLGDAGGGHMSAARAMQAGFLAVDPELKVEVVNLSDRVKTFPFNATDSSWKLVSKSRPARLFSDLMYGVTNSWLGDKVARKLVVGSGRQAVIDAITDHQPDIVVSTHFIVSTILEAVKPQYPNLISVSIAADLVGFPRMLADHNADLIFCATSEAADRLKSFGIAPSAIRSPHFPVNANVASKLSRDEFWRQQGLDSDTKTILVTGGGVGTVSMLPLIERLLQIPNIRVVVICAKSEESYTYLNNKFGNNPRLVLKKFVPNLPEYMNASDIIVAKPGPATVIEIEILSKPAIFTNTIGKQEYGNVEFLKQNPNFVYLPDCQESIEQVVDRLLYREAVPFTARFNTESSAKIAEEVLRLKTS